MAVAEETPEKCEHGATREQKHPCIYCGFGSAPAEGGKRWEAEP